MAVLVQPSAAETKRLAGLDVLRALAITFVLLSHCGDMFARWYDRQPLIGLSIAGLFGVELFFVLSGFLIGGIVARTLARRFDLRTWRVFILRRWMRTLPLYVLVVAALALVFPPHFWAPDAHAWLIRDLAYYGTLTQNLAWPMVDDWFGVSWSLTAEEWFYVIFPLMLAALSAVTGRRAGMWVVLAIFLCVPTAARLVLASHSDIGAGMGKIALLRLDSFAFGMALAQLRTSALFRGRAPWLLLAAGAAIIGTIWARWFDAGVLIGPALIYNAISFGFACILPAAVGLQRIPGLAGRVVRVLSERSYSLYIIHLSVLEIVAYWRNQTGVSATLAVVVAVTTTAVLSQCLWRYVEAPIIAMRPRQPA